MLNNRSFEITGPFANSTLMQLSLDVAFIGVNGFDANGPGTVDEYEAETNRAMATRTIRPIVVADSSKFGHRSFSSVGSVDVISTIVTDDAVADSVSSALQQRGVITHVGTVNDVASWPDSDETIDVAGAPLVPGYIDIHHHGGGRVAYGDGLEAAAATSHPARAIGVDDKFGTLAAGYPGDVIVLDPETLLPKGIFFV